MTQFIPPQRTKAAEARAQEVLSQFSENVSNPPVGNASGIRKKVEGGRAIAGGVRSNIMGLAAQGENLVSSIVFKGLNALPLPAGFKERLAASQEYLTNEEVGSEWMRSRQAAIKSSVIDKSRAKGVNTDSISYNLAFGLGESIPLMPAFGATNALVSPVATRLLGKYASNRILQAGVSGALSSPLDTMIFTQASEARTPTGQEFLAGLLLDAGFSAAIPGVQISTGAAMTKSASFSKQAANKAAVVAAEFDKSHLNGRVANTIQQHKEAVASIRAERGAWYQKPTLKGKAVGFYDAARDKLWDPSSTFQDEIRELGGDVRVGEEATLLEQMMEKYSQSLSSAGAAKSYYQKDGLAKVYQDIYTMKGIEDPKARFDEYLLARALEARAAEGKAINGKSSLADATKRAEFIALYDDAFRGYADTVFSGMKKQLKREYDGGLITKAEYEAMNKVQDYVPLYAIKKADNGYTVKSVISGQSTGIKAMGDVINVDTVEDIAENVLRRYVSSTARIRQMEFKRAVVDGIKELGGDVKLLKGADNKIARDEIAMEISKLKKQRPTKKLAAQKNKLRDLIGQMKEQAKRTKKGKAALNEMPSVGVSLVDTAKTLSAYAKKAEREAVLATLKKMKSFEGKIQKINDQISELVSESKLYADEQAFSRKITLRRKGLPETYQVPERVYRFFTATRVFGGKGFDIINKFTRILKGGITGADPSRILKNMFWDVQNVSIYLEPDVRKELLRSTSAAAEAFFEVSGRKDLFDRLLEEGAITFQSRINKGNLKQSVVDMMPAGKRFKAGSRQSNIAVATGKEVLNALEKAVDMPEIEMRFRVFNAAYTAYLKRGASPQSAKTRAILEARNVLPDYEILPDITGYLQMFFPYAGAGVASLRSLKRALVRDPKRVIPRLAVQYTLPAMALYAAQLANPRKREIYEDLAEYEFQDSFIYITDGAYKDKDGKWQGVYKAPITPEFAVFLNAGRHIVAAAADVDPLSLKDIAKDFGYAFNPYQGSATPAAFAPLQAVRQNVAWHGGPITWDYKSEQDAGAAAKMLGNFAQSIGARKLSPKDIQYIINSTGAYGGMFTRATDVMAFFLGAISGEDMYESPVLETLLKDFKGAAGGQKKRDYYEAKERQAWEKQRAKYRAQ